MMKTVKRVAIIGTAGRGKEKLSKEHFTFMCESVVKIIREEFKLEWQNIELVSGGAAWADHSAVKCFLNDPRCKLTLYLPCKWTGEKYEDIGVSDWKKNPGRTSNLYHEKFSNTIGCNSLQELQKAASLGATLDTRFHGFHNRNSQVAKSDFLIAFTWSTSGAPDDGGTLDTWKKATSAQKVHVSLCNVGSNVATSTSMKRKQEQTLQQEESLQKRMDNCCVNESSCAEESVQKRVGNNGATLCAVGDKNEYAVEYVSEFEYAALEKACKEAESFKRVKLDK